MPSRYRIGRTSDRATKNLARRLGDRTGKAGFTTGVWQDDYFDFLELGGSLAKNLGDELKGLTVIDMAENYQDNVGVDFRDYNMDAMMGGTEYSDKVKTLEEQKTRPSLFIDQKDLDEILTAFQYRQEEVSKRRLMPGISGAMLSSRT